MKQKIRKQNKYRVNIKLLRIRTEEIQYWQEMNDVCNTVARQIFGGFLSSLAWSSTDLYYELGLQGALTQMPYYIKKKKAN
jgi:hypothetical protein